MAADGPLAQTITGFQPRAAQLAMAEAVADAIASQQSLIAEAGTGTGKTFAYLVPALLSGGKVLISTASKTLQDQLFDKDLPLVRAALKRPVSVALLKGRGNYVCKHHVERALQDGRFITRDELHDLRLIRAFSAASGSGDRAECSTVSQQSPAWRWAVSQRENCLGSQCSFHGDCHVVKVRRQAMDADVVVINHHLFLADAALREEGVAEILPAANTLIFDEAHQLADIATEFLGQQVSTHRLQACMRDILVEGRASARDAANWDEWIRPFELSVRDLRLASA